MMLSYLQSSGWAVYCLNLSPNNGNIGLDELAQQIVAYVDSHFAVDQTIDLVGLSMGGLISRYYLQRLGGIDRVQRLITISSPHKGTWTAVPRSNPGARQIARGALSSAS